MDGNAEFRMPERRICDFGAVVGGGAYDAPLFEGTANGWGPRSGRRGMAAGPALGVGLRDRANLQATARVPLPPFGHPLPGREYGGGGIGNLAFGI